MFAGKYKIFHTGVFCNLHPLLSVELNGIELLIKIIINLYRNRARAFVITSSPLAAARPADFRPFEANRSPMDKQTELQLPPPVDHLWLGCQGGLGRRLDRRPPAA